MKKILINLLLSVTMFSFFSCREEKYINQPGNLVPKTVIEDNTLPSIVVNNIKLHSEAFGNSSNTMIIAVHGGPGGDYRYMLNCKELAYKGYYIVFYDQRGSGLSQRLNTEEYTQKGDQALEDMYKELKGVIEHYRTSSNQKVILLGHSWGGILVSAFVGKYPNMVNGLIVCEPGGLKWEDLENYVKNSRSFKLWSEISNDATYLDQFMTGKENQHEILDYKLNILASKNDITGEDNTLPQSFWRSGAVINTALFELGDSLKPDFSQNVKTNSPKTLFLYSENNKEYTTEWANKISSAYSSVIIQKITGVGHNGILSDKQVWQQQTMPKVIQYIQSL
ncbi:alpha/beta fold hydrolase [Candidatus Kaistella beijingensis]|uniref:alpha/beta hydrolase n=1 Tax=Candidatus Kaistella beijingensis TaxID=2820270 RepID=UPI000EE59FC9|nr:alpha/beta hydrolase [Candidatus Kaistella beijingensis]UBB90721.1 alpha/beta fold hydrolase [Candidatus Kaistella beijingensis]HCN10811.1 alpha/beta hydrolase [Chryseobacterium sp.]